MPRTEWRCALLSCSVPFPRGQIWSRLFLHLMSASPSVFLLCFRGKLEGSPQRPNIKQACLSNTGQSDVWTFFSINHLEDMSYMNRWAVYGGGNTVIYCSNIRFDVLATSCAFWLSSYLHKRLFLTPSVFCVWSDGPTGILESWLMEWPSTHLSLRVSHCPILGSKGQISLG